MMTNITMFIKHVKYSSQGVTKVTSTEFDRILYEVKMLQANVHKHVVVHRQKVTKKKTGNIFFYHDVVYIFCHLKNRDLEPQKWVVYVTFFHRATARCERRSDIYEGRQKENP